MAGIVAAETDNGAGIAGVGYAGVKVMPVTVLGADGTGQDSDIIEGVVWAADHGADVILMSFSNPGYSAVAAGRDRLRVVAGRRARRGDRQRRLDRRRPSRPATAASSASRAPTMTDALCSSSNYGADDVPRRARRGRSSRRRRRRLRRGHAAPRPRPRSSPARPRCCSAIDRRRLERRHRRRRLARNADAAGTPSRPATAALNLARALADTSTDAVAARRRGAGRRRRPVRRAVRGRGEQRRPRRARMGRDEHDDHVQHALPQDDRRHGPARPDHAAGRLHEHQRRGDRVLLGHLEHTGRQPGSRTIDVQLTAGTGLATNNVGWARIDVTATTPLANQSGNAAEWLMQTFTNTAGTAGGQNDNPPVLIGDITNPSATITFLDGSRQSDRDPGPPERRCRDRPGADHTDRERDQVHRYRRPDLLQQPDGVTRLSIRAATRTTRRSSRTDSSAWAAATSPTTAR